LSDSLKFDISGFLVLDAPAKYVLP